MELAVVVCICTDEPTSIVKDKKEPELIDFYKTIPKELLKQYPQD